MYHWSIFSKSHSHHHYSNIPDNTLLLNDDYMEESTANYPLYPGLLRCNLPVLTEIMAIPPVPPAFYHTGHIKAT